MTIQARLDHLGIKLPEAAAPVASYVPVAVHGDLAYVSGQLPFVDGQLVTGRLGEDVSLEDGMAAARACGVARRVSYARAAYEGGLPAGVSAGSRRTSTVAHGTRGRALSPASVSRPSSRRCAPLPKPG